MAMSNYKKNKLLGKHTDCPVCSILPRLDRCVIMISSEEKSLYFQMCDELKDPMSTHIYKMMMRELKAYRKGSK